MSILVIGSVALDSVETPFGKRKEILGGSATFFSIAASFFGKVTLPGLKAGGFHSSGANPACVHPGLKSGALGGGVNMVAAVGGDFPQKYVDLFKSRGIGTDGLSVSKGKTFRWKGWYDYDLNTAHTISTHLNVFKDFDPQVPQHLRRPELLFLANIDPDLQYNVLSQVERPKLVACDSMNYWIDTKKGSLKRLCKKIDVLLLNDAEARQLSGESNLIKASRAIISYGPRAVIIKRGEYGVIYFSKGSHFIAPAYLLETIFDPTGAGDTFAGGMVGYLASVKKINDAAIRKGIIYGSVMASFTVEDFGVNRLLSISSRDISRRFDHYRSITEF